MRVLGRRRLRHRAPRTGPAPARGSVRVELPEAPEPTAGGVWAADAQPRPAPLTLPLTQGAPPWAFPAAASAAFLAAMDAAPPGAVLDVQQGGEGGGEHALLAAVYSTRPVRALAPDAARAHATRQAAATNALPVVVEERALTAESAHERGETLDAYVARTALEPAVLRLADPHGAAGLLAGARRLLAHRRPWVVLGAGSPAGGPLPAVLADLGYAPLGSGVLAPGGTAGAAFELRSLAWRQALATMTDETPDGRPDETASADPAGVELRDPADAVS